MAVTFPVFTVLFSASLMVAGNTMCKHHHEEAKEKVREERTETSNQSPRDRHHQICQIRVSNSISSSSAYTIDSRTCSVVRLTADAKPARSEKQVSVCSLDISRVLDMGPRQLRESILASHVRSVLLHTETVLLGIAGVMNVVAEEKKSIEEDGVAKAVSDRLTGRKLILHHVDRSIAVCEGYTGHVPKDKHESWETRTSTVSKEK